MKLRAILAAVLTLAALGFVGSATAAQAAPYPPSACATLSVSTSTPNVGATITVTGKNFTANASVHLVLRKAGTATDGTDLTTVTADGNGSFSTHVTMPGGSNEGSYLLLAMSGAPGISDCPADPVQTLSLNAPGNGSPNDTPGSTAFTGANIAILLIAAAALVGAGVMLNGRSRTRRPHARR